MSIWSTSKGILEIAREAARHLHRRPTTVVAVAARAPGECWLLVRKVDSADWELPGVALQWDETLREAVIRSLSVQGVRECEIVRVVGVDSGAEAATRGPHEVVVLVECAVRSATNAGTGNGDCEARFFDRAELPSVPKDTRTHGLLDAALAAAEAFVR